MGSLGSNTRKSTRSNDTSIRGNVTFEQMMSVAKKTGTISFSKIVTVMPKNTMPQSGRKKELESLLDRNNINAVVVNMYRDKAGANDLRRMKDLGFEIVASYKGNAGSSKIPPTDYYYMRRKKR